MKFEYSSPEVKIIYFECDDIICRSTDSEGWYTPDTELGGGTTPGKDGW